MPKLALASFLAICFPWPSQFNLSSKTIRNLETIRILGHKIIIDSNKSKRKGWVIKIIFVQKPISVFQFLSWPSWTSFYNNKYLKFWSWELHLALPVAREMAVSKCWQILQTFISWVNDYFLLPQSHQKKENT